MILEQDQADGAPVPRGGVPQGRQPHVLLHRGLTILEELLPGLRGELIAAGGVPLDTIEGDPSAGGSMQSRDHAQQR